MGEMSGCWQVTPPCAEMAPRFPATWGPFDAASPVETSGASMTRPALSFSMMP